MNCRSSLGTTGLCSIVCLFLATSGGCSKRSTGREAFMLNMYFNLYNYAGTHNGWFPQSERGATAALQKLYPEYCKGAELAGLTGDVSSALRILSAGQNLTNGLCSWKYFQGFSTNDEGGIAILWESRAGVLINGATDPSGGHAVLFLDGHREQIAASNWPHFLLQQEKLRDAVLAKRKGNT